MSQVIVLSPEELDAKIYAAVARAFDAYKIQSTTQDELLTIDEVCKLIKRGKSWLQRTKLLRPVSTGTRNVRYSGKQVNEYLNSLRK